MRLFESEPGFMLREVIAVFDRYGINLIRIDGGAIGQPDGHVEEVWFFEKGDVTSPVYPMGDDDIMAATVIRTHCDKLGVPLTDFWPGIVVT